MAKKRATRDISVLEDSVGMELERKSSRAQRLTRVGTLMSNQEEWDGFLEAASMGASLGTLEARIGLNEGTLKEWLEKGKDETQRTYAAFRKALLKSVSEARGLAEGILLQKNPEKWLERNSAANVVERVDISGTGSSEVGQGLQIGEQLLEALGVLRGQGYDLNELLDNKAMLLGKVHSVRVEGGKESG